jgi:SAM-dependent methyltransferase
MGKTVNISAKILSMTDSSTSLAEWLNTPLGAYTLAREREWLDTVTPDIFGFHAVQLGLAEYDLLRESRITHRMIVSPTPHPAANVAAQFSALPFEAQSVDLCIMPHTLEFTETPHEILREIDRIMRPEGRILIIGFNPWSLYGMRRLVASRDAPWNGQFVSLIRMKDWLQLLSFEPSKGQLACYIPPVESAKWQSRWDFMEATGNRWWGVAGGVYMLEAIKRVQGMRLIAPAWSDRAKKERKFGAVANRSNNANTGNTVVKHLKVIK